MGFSRDSPSTLKPASAVHLPMEGAEEMAIISLRCLSARIGVRRIPKPLPALATTRSKSVNVLEFSPDLATTRLSTTVDNLPMEAAGVMETTSLPFKSAEKLASKSPVHLRLSATCRDANLSMTEMDVRSVVALPLSSLQHLTLRPNSR